MKKRLDLILFENGFFETKSLAAAQILAGNVKIDDKVVDKAGEMFNPEKLFDVNNPHKIEIKTMPFVSRGGLKLNGALNEFQIDLKDKTCIDMGASTGGFTDCMLQAGANKIYAVDVGYNQLAWKLREDKRVVNIEKTNIRNCTLEEVFGKTPSEDELPDFMSMDLSFISIKKVLENAIKFIKPYGEAVILIKPQFEAEKNEIQKGGVIKDDKIHKRITEDIKEFAESLKLEVKGIMTSPITGAKQGNTEYLIYLKKEF